MYSIIAAILSFPFILSHTSAATTGPGSTIPVTNNPAISSVSFEGPFKGETIESVLQRLVKYAQVVGASVAAVMILYGAFQILTSRGDIAKLKTGRSTILYALGGFVIVILAGGLVSLFATLVKNLGI